MAIQWTVVHFYNDNSVEPVPLYWVNIEGTFCVWPNNSSNANKLRMNRAKPNIFDLPINTYLLSIHLIQYKVN